MTDATDATTDPQAEGSGEVTDDRIIELDSPPNLLRMYGSVVRGMLPLPGGAGRADRDDLPGTIVRVAAQAPDLDHVAEYAEVCGFRLTSTLPPTYLFCAGLAGAMRLMTADDFPFTPLGSVHLGNTIVQHRPIGINEPVAMSAEVRNLRPHRRGSQMDAVMTGHVDGEVVWRNTATFMVPGRGEEDAVRESCALDDVDAEAMPLTGLWRVPGDIGRRYGAVSGDRNPIHISVLTAKPLGFDRAIAHGMWTTAKAISGLQSRIPDACEIEVRFVKPLTLPRTVEYATSTDGPRSLFAVRSPSREGRDTKMHLVGEIRPR